MNECKPLSAGLVPRVGARRALLRRHRRGRAVQIDPIRPTLKPPRSKRLKLEDNKLLSKFAFNFTLRRYTVAAGFGAGYAPTHVACHVIDTRFEP